MSVLTIAEIQAGIEKLDKQQEANYRMALEDWLFGELIPRFKGKILPINEKVALTWGTINSKCKKKGFSIPIIDGLIAATAMTHNLIVVTENDKDFINSGANVFNPWPVPK